MLLSEHCSNPRNKYLIPTQNKYLPQLCTQMNACKLCCGYVENLSMKIFPVINVTVWLVLDASWNTRGSIWENHLILELETNCRCTRFIFSPFSEVEWRQARAGHPARVRPLHEPGGGWLSGDGPRRTAEHHRHGGQYFVFLYFSVLSARETNYAKTS